MNPSYLILFAFFVTSTLTSDEDCARDFLKFANNRLEAMLYKTEVVEFNYYSNITDENHDSYLQYKSLTIAETKAIRKTLMLLKRQEFNDADLLRQLRLLTITDSVLPLEKSLEFERVDTQIQTIWSTATIPSFHDPGVNFGLEEIFEKASKSKSPAELAHLWIEFINSIGNPIRQLFPRYAELQNEVARLNGFSDMSALWLSYDELDDVKAEVERLWQQIKPLYLEFHAYIRYRIQDDYAAFIDGASPIPIHLLGDFNGENWQLLAESYLPYENEFLNVSKVLQETRCTRTELYKFAQEFFADMDFPRMSTKFWTESVFDKPQDTKVMCHPTLFHTGRLQFRTIDCESPENFLSLNAALWLFGAIYYKAIAEDQPYVYKGFYVPHLFVLGYLAEHSVYTQDSLSKMSKNKNIGDTREDFINRLFYEALIDVPFFAFTYVADLWRWKVYTGDIKPDHYNCEWWKLVNEYQGLEPPIDRSEEDFDPVMKFRIMTGRPCIGTFFGEILALQLHKGLCTKVGEYETGGSKHLAKCNLRGRKIVGDMLIAGMSAGRSKPWLHILEVVGETKLDASAVLEFYDPLYKWLQEENAKNNASVGWGPPRRKCVDIPE